MFRACLCALILSVLSPMCHADNGQTGQAFLLDQLIIDGNLSDWPATLPKYPIQLNGNREIVPATDGFSANLRAAYSIQEQAIYLAIEVQDDIHSISNDPDSGWTGRDGIIAYVDFNHTTNGSGAALFLASDTHRDMLSGEDSWDEDVVRASWDDAEAVVRRDGDVTIYEWRISSPRPLRSNRTIGVDLLIADHDHPAKEASAMLYSWGPGFGKSQSGGRLADLLLVDPDTAMGNLQGQVQMHSEEPDSPWNGGGQRIRVTSANDPNLWFQPRSDSDGRYLLTLPEGPYLVTNADRNMYGDNVPPVTVEVTSPVTVNIQADEKTTAPPLVLRRVEPAVVMPERGTLFEFDARSEAALNDVVLKLMEHYQVPGASLALVKDGAVVFVNSYGVSNASSGTPVQEDTLFEAASITKAVFAFAVMRLAERGVIDLDKPLYQYLPFEDIAHDERYKKITARYVLSHQSGFPNWRWMNDDGVLDIKFYPGIKYGYSGEGFEYLGRVVSQLTGKSLEEVLEEEVLIPMGFSGNTFFADRPELHERASRGHFDGMPGAYGFPTEVGVAHSMYTEAQSFSAFMLGLLAQEHLSAQWYRNMLEPQVEVPLNPEHQPQWPTRYGLGFSMMNSPFGLAYGHGGNNGDFTCLFELYPEHNMGFVVFTNADSGSLLAETLRTYLVTGSGIESDNAFTAK